MTETLRRFGNYVFDTSSRPVTQNRFGKIYHGRDERHNRDVAVLLIIVQRIRDSFDSQSFQHKVEYLKAIRGPNIVQLYDIIVDQVNGYIYVVTEACHHRELGILLSKTRVIPEEHALRLVRHVASAMILIRDLAPRLAGHHYSSLLLSHNLLTPSTIFLHGGRVKIADSGIYALLEDAIQIQDYPEPVESSYYEAPEVHRQLEITHGKADIWSLGVIFYQCLYGDYPFRGNTIIEMHEYLERIGIVFPDEIRPETQDLLRRMLTHNPKSRISWSEILTHPAMQYALVIRREGERKSFKDLEINLVTALENIFNEIEDPSILMCPHLKPSHERLNEKIARDEYNPVQEVEEDYYIQGTGTNRVVEIERREVIQVYDGKQEAIVETITETYKPVQQTSTQGGYYSAVTAGGPTTGGLYADPKFTYDGISRKKRNLARHKCNIF